MGEYDVGLEGAIAECRALWDENSVGDVYCCQMFGDVYGNEFGALYEYMYVEIVIGSTGTEEGPGELHMPWTDMVDYDPEDEYDDWITFAAEVFKSS